MKVKMYSGLPEEEGNGTWVERPFDIQAFHKIP